MNLFYIIVGLIAGVLSLGAYILYIYATLYGSTRPNRATWWVLTLVGLLTFSSYYSSGARETIWVPLVYTLGPLIIALISIKRGEGGWTVFDRWCLVGVGSAVLVWIFTNSPLSALLIGICIDFLGILPTIKKSYLRPTGENRTAWVLEEISSIMNIFAVRSWIFAVYIYPLYLIVVNGVITVLLTGFWRKYR